jgi:hypothetical protein
MLSRVTENETTLRNDGKTRNDVKIGLKPFLNYPFHVEKRESPASYRLEKLEACLPILMARWAAVFDGVTMPRGYRMNRRTASFLSLVSKTFFEEKA